MGQPVETPTERLFSWALAILIAFFVLSPIAFFAGLGLVSLGIGISNKTHLPVAMSWALVLIYMGVVVTTVLRIHSARARRRA
jgi:uncharacterized RDD family membrane protein YckC